MSLAVVGEREGLSLDVLVAHSSASTRTHGSDQL
jgi:hypothetical protein